MSRYLIEVAYNGKNYAGFQIQKNANTIQAEVQNALEVCLRRPFELTGSSRTDAGVHALQNFFHFDSENLPERGGSNQYKKLLYSLNSVLPGDIMVRGVRPVNADFHARFSAVSREYRYGVYKQKNPFYQTTAYYYPYPVEISVLESAAKILLLTRDFTAFSKRNTQVNNFFCTLYKSEWKMENDLLVYNVAGNRFLRGMVRGMVGTMLKAASGKILLNEFKEIIESKDCTRANFAVPPNGLFLRKVNY
ncbi:MAG: tRNA pseudouridine(38-40) synthase TruA [Ginsengibacter sp.]